jgi:hypothetical protein
MLNSTSPTSTVFSVGTAGETNQNGNSYVAYLFASNAGGFGLTGTDNVISCGSYTGNGLAAGPIVNLGYEPQWILVKGATDVSSWRIGDNMRGLVVGSDDSVLIPNSSAAETLSTWMSPTATGFQVDGTASAVNTSGSTYIYIAIRRGPMKVPTTGTSVFQPVTYAGNGGTQSISTGKTWPQDLLIGWDRNGSFNAGLDSNSSPVIDRLRGFYTGSAGNAGPNLATYSTSSEASTTSGIEINQQFDYKVNYTSGNLNASGRNYVDYLFSRAPSFFDEVCYTGTGANTTVTHNLGVVPEMMIVKKRSGVEDWGVYTATTGNTGSLRLNTTGTLIVQSVVWNNTSPTASVFSVGTNSLTNSSGATYVAYLFATCAGVSKVGSYTGTGALQTVNCGFTSGARFVLIKRTDTTGDWWTYDSARGITSGNDPYLFLNSTAAEVTSTNYVDTDTTGFKVTAAAPAGLNASGGTYIFLAIA